MEQQSVEKIHSKQPKISQELVYKFFENKTKKFAQKLKKYHHSEKNQQTFVKKYWKYLIIFLILIYCLLVFVNFGKDSMNDDEFLMKEIEWLEKNKYIKKSV